MSGRLYLRNSKNVVATNCNGNVGRPYYIQVDQNNAIFQLHSTRIMPDPMDTKFTDPRLRYKYRSKTVQEQNARKQR